MSLAQPDLRHIAEQALQDVIAKTGQVEVSVGANVEGHPAYFFDIAFDQDRDRAHASLLRTRLRQKIRDMLLERDDLYYPYVRIRDIDQ